ncbi:integral membrane protein [Aspergillus sp. HF37]|nr:integral membrane protein [Aspergillus sp. HF37]
MVMTMGAFMTIALYNVIELHVLLFTTFKRKWHGLYFWSVLASTWGVAINGLAVLFEFFQFAETKRELAPVVVFLVVGWYPMVTGQALVLYSRLHLLAVDARIIRAVLIMIIVNAIILHIPNTVVIFLVNFLPSPSSAIMNWYLTYEPLQLTLFSVQELIISALYVFRTVKVLNASQSFRGTPAQKTLMSLIYINIFIVAMDVVLVAIQFAGYDTLQHFFKPAVYSVKLKLEFTILLKLVEAMRGPGQGSSEGPRNYNSKQNTASRLTNLAKSTKNFLPHTNDEQNGYQAFATGKDDKNDLGNSNNDIPLNAVGQYPERKTLEVAIDYADEDRGHKPRSASQSSSQVQFAKSGYAL